MIERVLLLGASRYSFNDQGRKLEGTKIMYIGDSKTFEENKIGFLPVSLTGDISLFDKLKDVPGYYNLSLSVTPGGKGAVIKLNGLEFDSTVDVKQHLTKVG